jgi:hypothetical protein
MVVERRPLIDGLKPTTPASALDAAREQEFVFNGKSAPVPQPQSSATHSLSRVPISTRIRGDFSTALKRASLERQLNGVEPNTLQDLLEKALEPWLKSNGYLR